MGARGLKAKITISFTLLLLVGMVSIDLVTMMTAQRNLIRSEVSKGKAIARLVAGYLIAQPTWEDFLQSSDTRAQLGFALDEAGASCLVLLGRNQQQLGFGISRCTLQEEVAALAQQAYSTGEESVHFIGSTFGFFWMQHEYLVIVSPLRRGEEVVASFSLVVSLEGIYRSLRHSQQILFLYLVVNTVILAFVGIYRVFKLYLQPLARLAKRAEDYKEDDDILFAVRKEDNELQRLSSALNGLLRRLSAEKEKLRFTVASLETANAGLKKAQTEIIRAEKLASVGRLSAGIAHEIGNPIGIVTGYLELMKQADISEEERNEFLDRAQMEIERISAIIRQLLEISRPSHGGSQPVSVHALIDDMAEGLRLQPFMSHIRLQTDFHAQDDTVAVDSNQLRQVFLNLIINAADAVSLKGRESQGELIITTVNPLAGEGPCGRAKNWLHIHFSDTGAGIPEENLACIFDPFFTTKDPGKGTGLGLSVSFMIIESFGGTLRAESKTGEGTNMTVALPVVASTEEAKPVCQFPAGVIGGRPPGWGRLAAG
jgi:signal transduction histidine kinase